MKFMLNAGTIIAVLLLMLWIALIFDIGDMAMHTYSGINNLLG